MSTDPKPPTGTKAAGRRLWTSITSDYDLEEHELTLLRQAVRVVDVLDALDAMVASEGLVIDSPQGKKAHPATVEARAQRIVLGRLLVGLRVPLGEEGDHQPSARPQRRGGFRGVHTVKAAR